MSKTLFFCFLFSISWAFAQKGSKDAVITKITTSVCECTSKKEIKKDNIKLGLGICLIEAMNTHKAAMLKAYKAEKISKDLVQEVGEDAGEKMVSICPEIFELIMSDDKLVGEIISGYSERKLTTSSPTEETSNADYFHVEGMYTATKTEGYLYIVVKETSGKINNFVLLHYFDNAFLITDQVLLPNHKVKVTFYETELYDFKLNAFITFKIISNLTLVN